MEPKCIRTKMENAAYLFGTAAAIAGFVATAFGLYAHYRIACIWSICTAACLTCIAATCYFVDRETRREAKGQEQLTTPAALKAPPPDYIVGTQFTHSDLKEFFPFGFVIYSSVEGRTTYTPFPGDHVEWQADWSKVSMSPDFIRRKVLWHFQPFDLKIMVNGKTRINAPSNEISITATMAIGRMERVGVIVMSNQPEMYIGTLSDNQRAPIFVLGFRINDLRTQITLPKS